MGCCCFAEHVCRLVRVLRRPAGHGLLVGKKGSGRSVVARVAALIVGAEVVSAGSAADGPGPWRRAVRMALEQSVALVCRGNGW